MVSGFNLFAKGFLIFSATLAMTVAVTVTMAVTMAVTEVRAEDGSVPTRRLETVLPHENGMLGVLQTYSAKSIKPGAMFLGGAARSSGSQPLNSSTQAFLSLGLGQGLDISAGLPIYYENISNPPDHPTALGLGDASLFLKWGFPSWSRLVSLDIFGELNAPTSANRGLLPKRLEFISRQHEYPDSITHPMGVHHFAARFGLGATVDFSDPDQGDAPLLHINFSGWKPITKDSLQPLGHWRMSLAAEISPQQSLRLQAEIKHELLLARPADWNQPHARSTTLGLGMGIFMGHGLSMQIGSTIAPPAWNPLNPLKQKTVRGDVILAHRIYPTASVFLSAAWQFFPIKRDGDRDGVADGQDNCLGLPEDQDGFQDQDGCPEGDNDRDGILDGLDRCPYVAEDFDHIEDGDGCPDVDNDRDGLLEPQDQCPQDPEDKDEFQDDDGCPDFDNDGDGLFDLKDKCPLAAENYNGVEDKDGCPEIDRDGDGIADAEDSCPTEKEITNFYEDADGCPDQRPDAIREEILHGLEFAPGTADLLPGAEPILKALVVRLKAYPGMGIEIQAHVDDQAGEGARALTEARAEAVADALNLLGIDLERLKRTGKGFSQPRTSNRTAKGRESNRRIEIHPLN